MEKLIEDFISKLERLKVQEAKKINSKNEENTILFLSGKIAGFEYCIKELQDMISENKN